ncbi:MAG: DUF4286 family protein [Gemmatimonadota bacterium]
MIRYEVTVDMPEPRAADFEAYMRTKHIPEILATGCFAHIRFDRAGPTRFRTCYHAATRADFERYLADHAARFRADFAAHFGGAATVSRDIWETVQSWPA